MNVFRSTAVITAFATCLLTVPVQAQQDGSGDPLYQVEAPDAFSMVGDLVIARPLLIAGTVLGAGLFVITLPFTAPVGATQKSAKALVVEPARSAFVRCLGCTETGRYREENR